MEYTDKIGDAFFRGPLNGNTANPTVTRTPIPANW